MADLSRQKNLGQFWTPDWVAEIMVRHVAKHADHIFDPAVGAGAFYTALKREYPGKKFIGVEIDTDVISAARAQATIGPDADITIGDFVFFTTNSRYSAIVANPPYIRHQRITQEQKTQVSSMCHDLGYVIDGRASLHVYFLIKSLELLDDGGQLVFIMPADAYEGVFAKNLWSRISEKFCIDAVVVFDKTANPFPGLDINAVIVSISNRPQTSTIKWAVCREPTDLMPALNNNDGNRDVMEALSTGLTRSPRTQITPSTTLGDFASVVVGVATGANDFFLLKRSQVEILGIPDRYLRPCIARSGDVPEMYITNDTLNRLDKKGRPTLLLSIREPYESLPETVKQYLKTGEDQGLHKRSLISTRRPWFKMEVRSVPDFLFTYVGNRKIRFIKNEVGAIPLNGFLCIYANSPEKENVDLLWSILQKPETSSAVSQVGKTYGNGGIKVEPRALEQLPLSFNV